MNALKTIFLSYNEINKCASSDFDAIRSEVKKPLYRFTLYQSEIYTLWTSYLNGHHSFVDIQLTRLKMGDKYSDEEIDLFRNFLYNSNFLEIDSHFFETSYNNTVFTFQFQNQLLKFEHRKADDIEHFSTPFGDFEFNHSLSLSISFEEVLFQLYTGFLSMIKVFFSKRILKII